MDFGRIAQILMQGFLVRCWMCWNCPTNGSWPFLPVPTIPATLRNCSALICSIYHLFMWVAACSIHKDPCERIWGRGRDNGLIILFSILPYLLVSKHYCSCSTYSSCSVCLRGSKKVSPALTFHFGRCEL